MSQLSAPIIVCAANRYTVESGEKLIVPSARHFDHLMHALLMRLGLRGVRGEQGFIDQHGEFYTRKQAHKIALANKQMRRRFGGDEETLYSENLY